MILMPIATRRNPVDSAERARQDDLPTVDHRSESPQDEPQPHTPSGAPGAGGGRSTSLFERMRSSFGGVDAPEGSDESDEHPAVAATVFSGSQQVELKNIHSTAS